MQSSCPLVTPSSLILSSSVPSAVSIAPACAKYLGSVRLSPAGGGIFWVSPLPNYEIHHPRGPRVSFLARRWTWCHTFLFEFSKSDAILSEESGHFTLTAARSLLSDVTTDCTCNG
jgi:hypothetical protein